MTGSSSWAAVRRLLVTTVAGFVLVSCAGDINDFDTAAGVPKKEYEGLLGRDAPKPQERAEEPPIPQMQSVLAAPSAPELADTRRVSIAVTETTPLRDILIELARKAEVDLELDQRISGGIIMTATDRPFIEVIERIAELADLRYTFEKNRLSVTVDDPYMEQYKMNVLNLTRNTSSTISSSTDANSTAQAIGSGASGGGDNKSESSITSSSSADFWGTITQNVQLIIAGIKARRPERSSPIAATYVPQAEAGEEAARTEERRAARGEDGGGRGAAGAAAALGGRQQQMDAALAMENTGGPDSGTADAAAGGPRAGAGGGGASSLGSSDFSVNPQAGIVTVFATQRQHKAIQKYLQEVLDSVNQQVLIEAKILEVTLDDQYRAGINWTAALGPDSEKFRINSNFSRDVVPPDFANPTLSGIWSLNRGQLVNGSFVSDLTAAAQLIKKFGTVRALSNPRLTVVNNQTAVLKVAKNQVFFQIEVTTTDSTATTAGRTTVSSEIKTVPVGVVMTVQPAVDPVSRKISLSLRPSITRITGFVPDPGVQLTIAQFNQANPNAAQNISSLVPIIEAREFDSMVTMDSGETIVMGGLMQDAATNIREGIPGAMDIPILGQALSQNIKQNSVSELVIFIKATLVTARGTVADEDIRLYKTFTPDPRPVTF